MIRTQVNSIGGSRMVRRILFASLALALGLMACSSDETNGSETAASTSASGGSSATGGAGGIGGMGTGGSVATDCLDVCGGTACKQSLPSDPCFSCINTTCGQQYMACMTDSGSGTN